MSVTFERAGAENTSTTLQIAVEEAARRGLRLVVASTSGSSGLAALQLCRKRGVELIVVTHNTGFGEPGGQEFSPDARGSRASGAARARSRARWVAGAGPCGLARAAARAR